MLSSENAFFNAGKNYKVINDNLQSGVYFIKITTNGKSMITKVIK
jgi:hypothetical protein